MWIRTRGPWLSLMLVLAFVVLFLPSCSTTITTAPINIQALRRALGLTMASIWRMLRTATLEEVQIAVLPSTRGALLSMILPACR